ncbi:hypothetical protein [Priestia megaterium]|uniref:hypothetical protein n=1 Tax=Priestia megaterium TaxID=1404 RepID=UPI0011A38C1D|nr:hypothetical protein [Priestia megaterium]
MKNEYKHLDNDITMVYCYRSEDRTIEKIFIDTEDFSKMNAFKSEWKLFRDSGWTSGEEALNDYVVKTTYSGSTVTLHRYLMEVPDGKIIIRANGNKFDIRKKNLMVISRGERTKIETKRQAEEISRNLSPIFIVDKEQVTVHYDTKQITFENISKDNIEKLKFLLK